MKTSHLFSSAGHRLRAVGGGGRFVSVVFAILAVWFMECRGSMEALENWAYDRCAANPTYLDDHSGRVLLVELLPDEQADRLPQLLTRLKALGAKRIGLSIDRAEHFGPRAEDNANDIVYHRRVHRDPANPLLWRFSRPSTPWDELHRWGCSGIPFHERGICREHLVRVNVDGQTWPSFEAALADFSWDEFSTPDSLPLMRIRFRGGVDSLPQIPAAMVLEDRVIPQLVRDRVVLIGSTADQIEEYHTPTTTGGLGMSLLEVQGHVVNTMLSGNVVQTTSAESNLLLLFFTGLLSSWLYQRSSVPFSFLMMVLSIGLGTICTLIALTKFNLWIPVAAIMLLQICCFAMIVERKISYTRTALNSLLLEVSGRVWKRRWHEDFFAEENPWPQVISFIRQALDLERIMILELPAHKHHLHQVSAANCSLEDLQEPRRDIRRQPYSDALAVAGPHRIDVEVRPYLKPQPHVEVQYLVALVASGRVLGFIAVSAAKERIPDLHVFESRLGEFSEQAADLLNRHQHLLAERRRRKGRTRSPKANPESTAYAEVLNATNLLESRLTRFEQIFQQSTTASIIFDLFGRPMMVNDKMKDILHREQVNSETSTSVDVIVNLTGSSLDDARGLLARVLIDRQAESICVRLNQQKNNYILIVRPLEVAAARHREFRDEAGLLETQGILCELVDHSSFVDTSRLKYQLNATLTNIVQRDLVAVDSAATLMSRNHNSDVDRHNYETRIHETIAETVELLQACQRDLMADEVRAADACFPVDVNGILDHAVERLHAYFDAEQHVVRLQRPESVTSVLASPKHLQDAFAAVLEIIGQDAIRGSEIAIVVEQQTEAVVVSFSNHGVGVLTNKLHAALEGITSDEVYEPLRQAGLWLNAWGGNIVGTSVVGEGLRLRVHLIASQ